MKRIITVWIILILCAYVSLVYAHTYKSEEAQLDSIVNELHELGGGINKVHNLKCVEAGAPEVEVRILPTEQLDEIENRLTSGMDAMGAIRFAEKFLQAVYDYDFPMMKDMICPHPDVLSFFTEDVYPFALKLRKRDGMTLNAQKGIYSKCNGIADLDITVFSETEDIPGYYKANVYFDAFPKTDEAEFVRLRVMVFQNIEDGTFSIFSIK